MPNEYGQPVNSNEARAAQQILFFPSPAVRVSLNTKSKKSGPRCRGMVTKDGREVQCENLRYDTETNLCRPCGGNVTLGDRERSLRLAVKEETEERRNRYAINMPPEALSRLEAFQNDPERKVLDDEIALAKYQYGETLTEIRRRVMEREADENGKAFKGEADASIAKMLIGMKRYIAELEKARNVIESSERFLSSPQALSAMVARNKTRLRLSLEEAAGDNPSEEVIAALGRVWEAYNRMIAMGSVTVKEEPPTPPVAGYLEGSFTAEGG